MCLEFFTQKHVSNFGVSQIVTLEVFLRMNIVLVDGSAEPLYERVSFVVPKDSFIVRSTLWF